MNTPQASSSDPYTCHRPVGVLRITEERVGRYYFTGGEFMAKASVKTRRRIVAWSKDDVRTLPGVGEGQVVADGGCEQAEEVAWRGGSRR